MSNGVERGDEASYSGSVVEDLQQEYSSLENHCEQHFISVAAAQRVFRQHSNHVRALLGNPSDTELVEKICTSSSLVLAALHFAKLENLASVLFAFGLSDDILFDERTFEDCCGAAGFTNSQKRKLSKCRERIGVILDRTRHLVIPKDWVLPYMERNNSGRAGSYGAIYKVKIAPGHLKGYNKPVVAEKQISGRSDRSSSQWQKIFREVETLQRRQHPSIVPLLGSYDLETIESGDSFKTLHLIFPWAEMDLAVWMTKDRVPEHLGKLSDQDLKSFLYRSIYGLASGVAYLHQQIEGTFTSHHDLKPKNILVLDGQLKIADFGRSHLRPAEEGSATGDKTEVGTFEYRAPEYWKKDGSRADISHGRPFDVWALGCIIIELATLIEYGWESGELSNFRNRRRQNSDKEYQIPDCAPYGADNSFSNNWKVVKAWIKQLEQLSGSIKTKKILDVALDMMAFKPRDRSYMWEAEIALHCILRPDDHSLSSYPQESLCGPVPIWAGGKTVYELGENISLDEHNRRDLSAIQELSTIEDFTQTPLHRAASKGYRTRVVRLWALGWHLNLRDPDGHTPLDIMKQSTDGYIRTLESKVTRLLQAAKTSDLQTIKDLCGRHGISPAMMDVNGHTALELAIEFRQVQAVNCLLEVNPALQLYRMDRHGEFPLHYAARLGFAAAVERILIDFDPVNIPRRTWYGDPMIATTALYLAAQGGHTEVARLLLAHGALLFPPQLTLDQINRYVSPIMAALESGSIDLLRLLLKAKDVEKWLESRGVWGQTPLLYAASRGKTDAFEALTQHGANIHDVSIDGYSVVHYMAKSGWYRLLSQYINEFSEAELSAINNKGRTPLDVANSRGEKEIAKLLKSQLKILRRSAGSITSGKGVIGIFNSMFGSNSQ